MGEFGRRNCANQPLFPSLLGESFSVSDALRCFRPWGNLEVKASLLEKICQILGCSSSSLAFSYITFSNISSINHADDIFISQRPRFFLVLFLSWFKIRLVLYDLKTELLTTKQYHFAHVLHKMEKDLQMTERIARLFCDYLPENGIFF